MAATDVDSATAAEAPNVPKTESQAVTTEDGGHDHPDHVFTVTLKLPHEPFETKIQISTQEQVQDVRQSIIDQPFAMQYSCFHLEHNGTRINDFIELSEVEGVNADSVFSLVEDPYTEKEARMHIIRMREIIGASSERTELSNGYHAGTSLHDIIIRAVDSEDQEQGLEQGDLTKYDFGACGSIKELTPRDIAGPKTVKSISLSPFNPPPVHLRNRGHLLYLIVVNLEGEQFHITSHVSGFYVNKSSHNKFDPSPKSAKDGPKDNSAHSLLTLLQQIDSKFKTAFQELLDFNGKREALALFSLTNALPAAPWLVSADRTSLSEHRPDVTRIQESYLLAGTDSNDNLRDWNEEFQSTRELPTESVTEKVFRERLTSKLFADFNEASVKGAVMVARGELPPLNPTEGLDAQIFVHNNVFFSFGADGVGTFATEGGDEAARVATGKDVGGVQLVNQLDITGLFTAGSVIVDYLGKRIVAQSIVPGIFRQKEPEENQIDYGGVEGKDVIAENESFVQPFEALSKATYIKKHPVWDKEGKRHDLEASVDTKGLLGTDGRKYVLDLYRLSPLDIDFIEKHWPSTEEEKSGDAKKDYPHRMAILRPELIQSYRRLKFTEYIEREMKSHQETNDESGKEKSESEEAEKKEKTEEELEKQAEVTREIASKFSFTLNPDVFAGQNPQTDEEKEQMEKDEADVRAVCDHLNTEVIPKLVQHLQEGDVGFPMDGSSFTNLIHKRGINIRYLGKIAELSSQEHPRLKALRALAIQEMVARAFKHLFNKYLRHIPPVFTSAAAAHLLNCLLGGHVNSSPAVELDESLRSLYSEFKLEFEDVTPENLHQELREEVRKRFRFDVSGDIVAAGRELQMLREIALKVGLQLAAKDYAFTKEASTEQNGDSHPTTNGSTNGNKKNKKKNKDSSSPNRADTKAAIPQTFHAEDVINFVPIVKDAAPKSLLAEEAFEGGRVSLAQDQREIGQELLLESLSLHEQIYGIIHPEVARMYLSLSNIYYSLEEKNAAAELARKAVVIAERTIGLDSSDTIFAYLNLALFEHGCGRSALALKYILHALELSKIVYGPNHPDSITIINNVAVMLQAQRRFHESRVWYESSVKLSDEVSGKATTHTATLLFQLGQALALDNDHRAAVTRMRESYNLFKSLLGPDDENTKQAETWLDQLTQNAVSLEKRAKDIASGKLKKVQFNLGPRAVARPGQSHDDVNGTGARAAAKSLGGEDKRSIDDLIKYINGNESKSPSAEGKSKGKKRGNPKRRGGASLQTLKA